MRSWRASLADENLEEQLRDFWEELDLEVEATGDPAAAAFFKLFASLAAANGDCADLTYTPVLKEGRGGYQVDGYSLDVERNELHLAICDFRQSRELEPLNTRDLDAFFQKAASFVVAARESAFIAAIEESSPAFEAGYPINQGFRSIRRIRIILLSNARLATRSKPEASGEILGIPVVRNILDLRRYSEIVRSKGAPEPIEIDIAQLNGEPLPCLRAHGSSGTYEAYLVVVPGELLARIYGVWGPRLLEQNVRSFLQARTKVNRGIIETIQNYPGMFFAYNNGLTATASGITTVPLKDGGLGIGAIHNLQIVNGGQTTASILYARDNVKADLADVFVQMKLSVIEPALVDEVVPDISRFANTQNKVSEADFFSNHPFHVEMEKMSRRLSAPPKPGAVLGSKWFYERARGQYKYGQAYGTASERRKFEIEFPRDQVVSKMDVARYALTFDCLPHMVSKGETKFFIEFAESVGERWQEAQSDFNEGYFKALIAKAIVFRTLDGLVGRSDWYKDDRGYKAQTVTYTIAWLVQHLRDNGGREINLQLIWNDQKVPDELEACLLGLAPRVAKVIRDTPSTVKNVGEYCKQKICWDTVRRHEYPVTVDVEAATIEPEEVRENRKEDRKLHRVDQEIELDVLILKLPASMAQIVAFARGRHLLSPKSNAALSKIAGGRLSLSQAERNALKNLVQRMRQDGFDFENP